MTSPDRGVLIAEIFGTALDLDPSERTRFLDAKCDDDPALRAEIESLLAADSRAPDGFLKAAAAGKDSDAGAGGARAGGTIGRYRLVRELGRGGQGTVHLAEDPSLGRQVALKVLDGLGPGSSGLVQRFEREARVASRLKHPAICPIYEAGVDRGIPYIAMQFIEGETLAARIARARGGDGAAAGAAPPVLDPTPSPNDPPRDRTARAEVLRVVRLVEQVARALHAAHEAGVVHRDVKPGNIMINAQGEPVVLDFGLARQEGTDLPSLTRAGDLFGTPSYMPPEQLQRADARLDRRSDVWSLGVTLYEAVTLRKPFEGPTTEALYQAIQVREPADPRTANPAIPKDLAVVVATALEKDRDRRYQTALAFAEDLRRVREREPILARPAGLLLRSRRWAERNPGIAAALALAFLFLGAGLVATWIQKDRAERAEELAVERGDLAEKQLTRAREATSAAETALAHHAKLTGFLTETLSFANPEFTLTSDFSVRSLLERTAAGASRALADQPEAEATVRTTIGRAWVALGQPDRAEIELQRALELREAGGASPAEIDLVLRPLVFSFMNRVDGRFETLGNRLMDNTPRIFAETHPELALALDRATGVWRRRQTEESAPACAAIENAAHAALAPEDPRWLHVAAHLKDVAYCIYATRTPPLSEPYVRAYLRILETRLPPTHPQVAEGLLMLSRSLEGTDRGAEAISLLRDSLAIAGKVLSPDHRTVLAIRMDLAWWYAETGQLEEATRLYLQTIPECERVFGPNSKAGTQYRSWVIRHFEKTGDTEAARHWRSALPDLIARAHLGSDMRTIATAFGDSHPEILAGLQRLESLVPDGGITPDIVARKLKDLGSLLDDLLTRVDRELPPSSPFACLVARKLVQHADGWRSWLDLKTHHRLVYAAIPILEKWPAGIQFGIGTALYEAATNASRSKDLASAERFLRRALDADATSPDSSPWRIGLSKAYLGALIAELGRHQEAEPFLLDGVRILTETLGDTNANTRLALQWTADLYVLWKRPAEGLPFALRTLRQGRSLSVEVTAAILGARSVSLAARLDELWKTPNDGARDLELLRALHEERSRSLLSDDPAVLLHADIVLRTAARRGLRRGHLAGWEAALAEAREGFERHLPPPRRRLAAVDRWAAVAAMDSGHLDEAEARAAALLQDVVGGERARRYGDATDVPTEPVARRVLAQVLLAGGKPAAAESQARQAFDLHVRDGKVLAVEALDALELLTRLLAARNADADLAALWSPLLDQGLANPDAVKIHDALAWPLAEVSGTPRALLRRGLELARRVAAAFGDGGSTYDLTLALFLTRLGEVTEALPVLDKVFEKNVPERDLTLAVRALALAQAGRAGEAREAIRRSKTLVRSCQATTDFLAEAEALLDLPPPER